MNDEISRNIEAILNKLGIEYIVTRNGLNFSCPIHGSSSKSAYIYPESDVFPPNWKCYTHSCHEEHGGSLVNFVKAVLKTDYKGCMKWLKDFNLQPEIIDKTFIRTTNIVTQKRRTTQFKIPVTELPKGNKPDFYLQRGFKEQTLKDFNVSLCSQRSSPFFNYILVPVFNDDKKSIAGIIGRNPNPKCLICSKYHKENDPCSKNGTKWKNTKGFHNNAFFYNLWNAKPYIEKFKEVVLVESAADVWRMYEAGIYNVLGMFGTSITIDQKIILESLPITKIKLFLDPDEAGIVASEKLKKYLDRFYTVITINYSKQPSECTPEELKILC